MNYKKHLLLMFGLFVCLSEPKAQQIINTISASFTSIRLSDAIKKIEQASEYRFFYDSGKIDLNQRVSLQAKDQPVNVAITAMLKPTDIDYQITRQQIALFPRQQKTQLENKEKLIRGKITDDRGEAVIGANIVEKGTTNGTITDIDGKFSLRVATGASLAITYIGYSGQTVKVGNQSEITVVLKEDTETLDEVVVVGYGVQKKVNLTGAVGTASGKMLQNRSVANVGQALQGAIGNLNITHSSGQAGSAPTFNIRGETSITGGEPLILVDNVPVTADEFSRINAQDIDNISVLKDASSAAIYGARASFGVILVTTKKGEGEKVKINYSGNVSVNNMPNLPELVTDPYTVANWKNIAGKGWYTFFDDETLDYARQRSADPSLPAAYLSAAQPETWQYLGAVNWFEAAFKKNSFFHNHNLSISGTTKKVSYYFSGEYYNNNGILKEGTDHYNRYNLRNKLDYKLTDWLELGTNLAYTYYSNDEPYNLDYFFHNLNRTNTLDLIHNPDGSWTDSGAGMIGRLAEGGRSVSKSGNFQGTFSATFNLIKEVLTVKANATYRKKDLKKHSWDTPVWAKKGPDAEETLTTYDPFTAIPFSNKYNTTEEYTVYDVFANFQKTFREKHAVAVVAGFNQEEYKYDFFSAGRDQLISHTLPSMQLATGEKSLEEKLESWALRGAFYRLNYTFDNKYMIETNGRYDGSSRFPKNDRFGFFPSVSGGWIISEENFFAPLRKVVDFVKIRGSYGALGNQNVGAYEYIANMPASQLKVLLDGQIPVGVEAPGLVASSLTWEKVKTVNGGIDFTLLSNRLSASFDLYRRDTKGMLAKGETLPNVLGTKVPKINAADLCTKGWEMSIGWRDQFSLGDKPFQYNARFILSDNRAVITKYANPTRSLTGYDASKLESREYYEGESVGEIWGLTTLGFFQSQEEIDRHADQTTVMSYPNDRVTEPGDLKFADLNGDGYVNSGNWTVDDPGDYRVIGNTTPRYNFSLDLYADWNNFDIRAFLQGTGKRDWYPAANNHYFWGLYAMPWTNVFKEHMDHWTPENRDAKFPRPKSYIAWNQKELGAPQTKYLQNAAYCRLKNLTLGYTIPKTLLRKANIEHLRIYFSGENLFTLKQLPRHIDPEGLDNNLYPYLRTFSFGINLTL